MIARIIVFQRQVLRYRHRARGCVHADLEYQLSAFFRAAFDVAVNVQRQHYAFVRYRRHQAGIHLGCFFRQGQCQHIVARLGLFLIRTRIHSDVEQIVARYRCITNRAFRCALHCLVVIRRAAFVLNRTARAQRFIQRNCAYLGRKFSDRGAVVFDDEYTAAQIDGGLGMVAVTIGHGLL